MRPLCLLGSTRLPACQLMTISVDDYWYEVATDWTVLWRVVRDRRGQDRAAGRSRHRRRDWYWRLCGNHLALPFNQLSLEDEMISSTIRKSDGLLRLDFGEPYGIPVEDVSPFLESQFSSRVHRSAG